VVTGMGLLSSLGSLSSSWEGLLALKSGIKLHQPFSDFPLLPLGLIEEKPGELNYFIQVVVTAALENARLVPPLPDCGVVIGSSRSYQAVWELLATEITPPNSLFPQEKLRGVNWLETLPNQASITAARIIGSTAPVLAPMAACATGIWAIAHGFELIQQGRCQRVLVGATEAPITRLTLAGFEKLGALAKTGCYPFDKQRSGLVLGEGAAVLILESAELALSRGAEIYGKILGFGFSCDAYHMSTPESSGKTARSAINQCLERSNISASDIDYIHAHGTGTKLNDAREAKIIQELCPHVAVSSTKGATGHTLGASGALAAAFSLMSLKYQQLPPCVGLKEAEFDLDFVRVTRKKNIENILCFSFGFGGQNAVMALGKQ